ncbi:NUDIX domain-containing protein [Kitasatospora sp. NA04385]|uniref:NUDIX hydrolase n=1 Tax=Kitasatospora sp. NA04385 TaxID=2742135 RepID=UPI001590455C|nr:NUDIX domain-containing protein [Kitasatospora sp. NA04385]QKW17839.1 NUDIX domain-containing protein [Kitasatospora sp. NA04385]
MPVTSAEIAATTRAYLRRHPGELGRLQPLLDLLAAVPDPTSRAALPAHVTCSGVVVDRDLRVLHVHHRATGLVLCPGGHGEPGDTSLLATAVREVAEETGIPPGALCLVPGLLDTPVDIDVNDIDPNPGKGEGAHRHYDFRFVLHLADDGPPPVRLQEAEVTGAEWRPLTEVSSPELRAKLLAAGLTGRPEPVNASALVHDGRGGYLLHLRDDVPGIWAPGEWSLLGGGREAGDATIEATLRRELAEEVPGLSLGPVEPLTVEWTTDRHGLAVPIQVFSARWDGHPDTADLREGVLVHWFRPADLHRLRLRDSTRHLIREHAATRPPALPGHRPLPAHPPTAPAAPMWGSVFFTTEDGRAVLLRATDPAEGLPWAGGDVEFSDPSPLHTAVRACAEETGIRLEPDPARLPLLATVFEQPGGGWPAKVGFAFHGGALTPEQVAGIRLDPAEHTEVVLLSRDELAALSDPRHAQLTLAVLDAARTGTPAHVVR